MINGSQYQKVMASEIATSRIIEKVNHIAFFKSIIIPKTIAIAATTTGQIFIPGQEEICAVAANTAANKFEIINRYL